MNQLDRAPDGQAEAAREIRVMMLAIRGLAIQMTVAALAAILFPYPALRALPRVFGAAPSAFLETINNLVVMGFALFGLYLGWQAITLWRKWYAWRRRYQQFLGLLRA